MRELELRAASGACRIILGGRLELLGELCAGRRVALITDTNVHRLLCRRLPAAALVVALPPGEGSKSIDIVQRVYARLVAAEFDRDALILGVGGGVVTDLAGFVAATYLRGIACGFAPTTLLAQVDAAIGGKNGVDLGGYKNLVGTIRQPSFVLVDPSVLASLPDRERRSGLAEVVKAAAIGDAALFALLEERAEELVAGGGEDLAEVVAKAVAVKVGVVARDEVEAGERRVLNFGHTLGHAVELVCGVPHGEAVAVGMAVAARLSVARGRLLGEEGRRLVRLLERLGLPTAAGGDARAVAEAIRKDKKRRGEAVRFVLLDRIGHAVVEEIELHELEEVALDLR